jgi:hypothetical protein
MPTGEVLGGCGHTHVLGYELVVRIAYVRRLRHPAHDGVDLVPQPDLATGVLGKRGGSFRCLIEQSNERTAIIGKGKYLGKYIIRMFHAIVLSPAD